MAANLTDVDDTNFESEVVASDIPVLVDFWAPWCGPCKALTPLIEKIAGEVAGKVKVVKVNIDVTPVIRERFQIRSIPRVMLLNKGELVAEADGATRTRIYDIISDYTE